MSNFLAQVEAAAEAARDQAELAEEAKYGDWVDVSEEFSDVQMGLQVIEEEARFRSRAADDDWAIIARDAGWMRGQLRNMQSEWRDAS